MVCPREKLLSHQKCDLKGDSRTNFNPSFLPLIKDIHLHWGTSLSHSVVRLDLRFEPPDLGAPANFPALLQVACFIYSMVAMKEGLMYLQIQVSIPDIYHLSPWKIGRERQLTQNTTVEGTEPSEQSLWERNVINSSAMLWLYLENVMSCKEGNLIKKCFP